MKILFLVPYTSEGASNRVRVGPYLRMLDPVLPRPVRGSDLRPGYEYRKRLKPLQRLGHLSGLKGVLRMQ
jgi:hypothetical protein